MSRFDLILSEEQASVIRRAVHTLSFAVGLCGGPDHERRDISAGDFSGFVELIGGTLRDLLEQLDREAEERRSEPVRVSVEVPALAWFMDALESGPAALHRSDMVAQFGDYLAGRAQTMNGYARVHREWCRVIEKHGAPPEAAVSPRCGGIDEGLFTWLVGALDRGPMALADEEPAMRLDAALRAASAQHPEAWAPLVQRWEALVDAHGSEALKRQVAASDGHPEADAVEPRAPAARRSKPKAQRVTRTARSKLNGQARHAS